MKRHHGGAVLSLAALALAGPASAADFNVGEDATLSVYGSVEPKFVAEKNTNGDTETDFGDEDSTLGFAAEHRIGANLVAFGQAEFEFTSDDDGGDLAVSGGNLAGSDGGLSNTDSAFVGLEGTLGTVQAGNFDSIYEEGIVDATEVAEAAEITDEPLSSENNQIAYFSPTFAGGVSVRTQLRYLGDGDANNPSNEVGTGWSIVASYSADTWSAHLGYDDTGAERVDQYDASGTVVGQDFADGGTLGGAAVVSVDPVEVAAKVAVDRLEANDPRGDERILTALRASYAWGHWDVWTSVQRVAVDAGEDRDEAAAGLRYAFADSLTLWSELGSFDRDNDAGDNFHLGAIYSF